MKSPIYDDAGPRSGPRSARAPSLDDVRAMVSDWTKQAPKTPTPPEPLVERLRALHAHLTAEFRHDEEALLPMLEERLPHAQAPIAELRMVNATIARALVRLITLCAAGDPSPSCRALMAGLFERFESAYVKRSTLESDLRLRLAVETGLASESAHATTTTAAATP